MNKLDVNLGFQRGLANIQFLISTIQINFSFCLKEKLKGRILYSRILYLMKPIAENKPSKTMVY